MLPESAADQEAASSSSAVQAGGGLCVRAEAAPISPVSAAPGKPWGFWASIGLGAAILLMTFVAQFMAVIAIIFANNLLGNPIFADPSKAATNGFVLALTTLVAVPANCGLSLLFASIRRNMTVKAYLGLQWPSRRILLRWLLALIGLVFATDLAMKLIGGPIIPDFMIEAHRSALFWPLFYFAIIFAAPLSEEFFFRGFLLEGLRASRLGKWGAVALTAAAWASLHTQYDYRGILSILVAGIFLGYARVRTGSLWLCVLMHGAMNLIASVELLVYITWFRH